MYRFLCNLQSGEAGNLKPLRRLLALEVVCNNIRDNSNYQEHGVEGYPPFSRASLDPKRANNRARGWNGLFSFSLKWKEEATAEIRKTILSTLTLAYGWKPGLETTLADWLYEDSLEVEIHLTGQRVKNLTRMLNRQYQKGYLVWKEL